MKLSTAVAMRVSVILHEKGMSQYRLERNIAMPHSTLKAVIKERNKSVNLSTVMQIIKGLDMTPAEFFDDPMFVDPELEID